MTQVIQIDSMVCLYLLNVKVERHLCRLVSLNGKHQIMIWTLKYNNTGTRTYTAKKFEREHLRWYLHLSLSYYVCVVDDSREYIIVLCARKRQGYHLRSSFHDTNTRPSIIIFL